MNTKQETHLKYLLDTAVTRISRKYIAGTREHRGCLADKSAEYLIDQAISEAVDQITYLLTLKTKIDESSSKKTK